VATAVDELLMMGMMVPETCWAVFKRQAIKLRNWGIWLVELCECMMIHGLTNPPPQKKKIVSCKCQSINFVYGNIRCLFWLA
jgi:hypothetical protein